VLGRQSIEGSLYIQGRVKVVTQFFALGSCFVRIGQDNEFGGSGFTPSQFIDPLCVYDSIKPTVQPGPLTDLIQSVQGTLAGSLNEIVRLVGILGKTSCESTQPWKKANHFLSQSLFR
jgi:hypothetical protein